MQKALTPQELDSLVAPIALYPDPILSQVLVASTYPLEIVEAERWVSQHPNLKGKELADAAKQQNWDASVQAMVAFPDLLNRMSQNVQWTSDLGSAFMAEQAGVMDAIQRLRQQASASGALKSTPQETVSTTTENGQQYIVIEPSNPEVVYIPEYNPVAVWGPAPYPYPSLYYPPYTGGLIAASAISFGAGIAIGAIWSGGWHGWGWHPGWGHNNITVNNNFIRNNNLNRVATGNGNRWVHNPNRNAGLPNRFQGGAANLGTRPNAGQVQQRLGEAGRSSGTANRFAQGAGSHAGTSGLGSANRSFGSADRLGQGGLGNHGTSRFGSADRSFSGRGFSSGGSRHGGFGGGSRGGFGGGFGRGGGGRRR